MLLPLTSHLRHCNRLTLGNPQLLCFIYKRANTLSPDLQSLRVSFTQASTSTRVRFYTMATHNTNSSLYKLNHTMIRVKDPQVSLQYYEKHFGMKLIHKVDVEDAKFSLYFLACDSPKADSHGKAWTDREGILELTHNYGTESDPNYKINNGNEDPHKDIAFSVDNLQQACADLESAGVKFQKRLHEGRSDKIAFALDPDGYWVELLSLPPSSVSTASPDKSTYRFNHTMLRCKDPQKSLQFYQSVLGMSLLRTHEIRDAKFNLYYLAYRRNAVEHEDPLGLAGREGIVQLNWDYGTEDDANFRIHNGNDQPQGFGHICITVDDLDEACKRFDELGVNWRKRLTDGRMKHVAFILDPDGYWVEILQNERLKSRVDW